MSTVTCYEPRPFADADVHEDPFIERCPGCGRAMTWGAPQNHGENGEWSCAGSCSVALVFDREFWECRYFYVDPATEMETDLGATFEAAAAKLLQMREGRA